MAARGIDVPRRVLGALIGLLLVAGFLGVASPTAARADSAPPNPADVTTPPTVAADRLPTVQVNGVVWNQAVVGDTVYAGGEFTRARPAGAAPGTNETVRNNLLAYDIRTGVMNASFAPDLNGQVLAVAASPDGSRIYVGGNFTMANGQPRNRIAAYDTATGQLVPTFRPSVNGQVRAIAVTGSTVYFGGNFSAVGSVARKDLAAARVSDGSVVESWAPFPGEGSTAGNRNGATGLSTTVFGLVVTNGGAQVVAGGAFDLMNGVKSTGVAAIDPVTGATRPFAINQLITNQGVNSAIYSLSTDGTMVFGTGFDYYGPGNLEGSFAAIAAGGAVVSINECHGDTYSSFAMGGALYLAGHPHICSNIGGYPESPARRALAVSIAPSGVVGTSTLRNRNLAGQPAARLQVFNPAIEVGNYTGQYQAAWTVTGTSEYVLYGGEFPYVNGSRQQGLVRFAVPSIAPNKRGPDAAGLAAPTASTIAPGTVRLNWTTTADQDNEHLTYRVYRDGGATPVGETTAASDWWRKPQAGFTDVGVPAGTHRYRVVATDPFGNTAAYPEVTLDVASGGTPTRPYAQMVRSDGAQHHWPLTETSGVARDVVSGADQTASSGVTRNQGGAIAGDSNPSYRFSGSNAFLSTQTALPAPSAFTVEAWFRTNSTAGGKILGFGNARTGSSTSHDRSVYVDDAGRLVFGVYDGARRTIQSPGSVEDGAWHHVAASLGSSGMALYLDGALVGSLPGVTTAQANTGYWRVGGDTSWSGAAYFNGWIDEPAVYHSALSPLAVAEHHALGKGTTVPNVAPVAAFTSSATGLTVAFDGTTSTDPENGALTYAWNFGGGATSDQPKPSHTFAAAGIYPVTLTVTDPAGASDSETRQITVTAPPNQAPAASFSWQATGLDVAFDSSGSSDSDGSITGRVWDFGDGTSSTEVSPAHTYAAGGSYTVTLTVTDDDGATGQSTQQVQITAPGSQVALSADGFQRTVATGWGRADTGGDWTVSSAANTSVSDGLGRMRTPAGGTTVATLNGVSSRDVALQHDIALSDAATGGGTFVSLLARRDGNTQYRAVVKFLSDGRAQLLVTRMVAGTDTTLRAVTLPATYTTGDVLRVRFDVQGSSPTTLRAKAWPVTGAEPATWQVTTTDSTAELQTAGVMGVMEYVSGLATTSPVRLGVDGWWAGAAGTTPGTPADAPPTAGFTHAESALTATFTNTSTDPENGALTHSWNFGDGSAPVTTANPVHTYGAAGTYTVELRVTDPGGQTDTETQTVTVTAPGGGNQPPVADFTSAPSGLTVSFTSTSTDPENGALTHAWDFGDGATSTQASPSHTYATGGDKTVTLTVTDAAGASDTETRTVAVTDPGPVNQAPTAGFSHTESGLTATFTNTSTDPENGALAYSWDFGDGSAPDTSAAPAHTYAAAGTYTVVLTATDPAGLGDTETQTVTVASTTPPWPGVGAVSADRFERSVANGWGTGEVGGAWTAPSTASVSGGVGRLQVSTAGGSTSAFQNDVSIRDLSLRADVSLEAMPTGGGASMTFMTRRVGAEQYRAVVKFLADGRVTLTFTRVAGGTETSLRGVGFPGLTYTAGEVLHLRVDVTGEGPVALQGKVWLGSAPEPATWQNTYTDSTAPLTAAGSVGAMLYSYSGNTVLPLRARVDNWWVGPAGTQPPTP